MSSADFSVSTPSRTLDPTLRGVLAMTFGMGLQALNDTVVKLASARLPAHEIMAVRGVLAVVLTLAAIIAVGQGRRLKTLANPVVQLRSWMEAGCCFVYFTALGGLGLAEFTSIVQATPLIITALAVLLGLQTVGWKRWAAIACGFAGVLMVAKPSAAGLNLYAALALLSAVIMAVRDLVTRRIPAAAPSLVVTLGATISVTALGLCFGAIDARSWVMPTPAEFALLAVASTLVVGCNLSIVLAFRTGDMTVVGPFRYSVIVYALILGFAVWGDRPDAAALVGAALIVGSGLYALKRERASVPEPAEQAVGAPG